MKLTGSDPVEPPNSVDLSCYLVFWLAVSIWLAWTLGWPPPPELKGLPHPDSRMIGSRMDPDWIQTKCRPGIDQVQLTRSSLGPTDQVQTRYRLGPDDVTVTLFTPQTVATLSWSGSEHL